MRAKPKPLTIVLATAALVMAAGMPAHANGLNEDTPWQFRSPAGTTAALLMEQLRQQKKGGLLQEWPYQSYAYSTNNLPIGTYNSVTAGNGTSVNLSTNSTNSAPLNANGELNGALP